MKISWRLTALSALGFALGATFVVPAFCRAQGTDPNLVPAEQQEQKAYQDLKQRALSDQKQSEQKQSEQKQSKPTKAEIQEEKAYKAFYDTSPQDTDKRIRLGEDFVKKYPSGPYAEAVYTGLVQAYYAKRDWNKFYDAGDKALAINPQDVDVLVTVGWVIPHIYNPSDPDANQKLSKAEDFEKRALAAIAGLAPPAGMTEQQFAALKADKVAEAHSGLGLVYFRQKDFQKAAQELQQATTSAHPDPTDFYALGAALQNTQQYSQAADAFEHCAQMPGSLQNQCKQNAEAAKKLAAQTK